MKNVNSGPNNKTAEVKPRKNKKSKTVDDSNEEWHCAQCKITYGQVDDAKKSEDWLSCTSCEKKYHKSCAEDNGVIEDNGIFVCKEHL